MYPGHWATVKPTTPQSSTRSRLLAGAGPALKPSRTTAGKPGPGRGRPRLDFDGKQPGFFHRLGRVALRNVSTCINRYPTPDEAAYIIDDSTSHVLFASSELA